MARALELARRGLYTTTPNPRVGCVLVHAGEIIGEGWHQEAGGPHAEINALSDAAARGNSVKGVTAYVGRRWQEKGRRRNIKMSRILNPC